MGNRILALLGWTVLVAIGVLAICLVIVVITWIPFLRTTEGASWAQAIGSFIAIGIAIWVPYRQHQKSERAESDARAMDVLVRLHRIREIVTVGSAHVDNAVAAFDSGDTQVLEKYFKNRFDIQSFADIASAIDAIPIYTLPADGLVYSLMSMKTIIGEAKSDIDTFRPTQFWSPQFAAEASRRLNLHKIFIDKLNTKLGNQMMEAARRVADKKRVNEIFNLGA